MISQQRSIYINKLFLLPVLFLLTFITTTILPRSGSEAFILHGKTTTTKKPVSYYYTSSDDRRGSTTRTTTSGGGGGDDDASSFRKRECFTQLYVYSHKRQTTKEEEENNNKESSSSSSSSSQELLSQQQPASDLSRWEIHWNDMYQKLVEFKSRFGHCDVPQCWKEDNSLGPRVKTQQRLCREGTLRPDREMKLNELQFAWNGKARTLTSEKVNVQWETSFQKLVEFKSRFGHCDVPAIWTEDPPLGVWVVRQRRVHSKGKLKPDRETKLNGIQFSWTGQARTMMVCSGTYDAKWDASYQKLVKYKKKYGHCRVPALWPEDPSLGNWAMNQRRFKSEGTLKPDREAKLEELQFPWNVQDKRTLALKKKWDASFQKLVEFKSRFGHCDVPQSWKEDPLLGLWVAYQRQMKSKGTLKPDREAKLNELQFTWSGQDSMRKKKKWDASYQKLVEFKSRFGHCDVPQSWKEDPLLGLWVAYQRQMKSKGKLKPDREAKLNEIKFIWIKYKLKK